MLSTPPAFVLSQDQTLHKGHSTRPGDPKISLGRVNLEEILTGHSRDQSKEPSTPKCGRGQNKHGLKKIKHALLSSQETITLPVQAPEPLSRSALPWKALFAFAPFPVFPAVLCLYFIRYSVSRNSAVFGVPDRGKARLPLFVLRLCGGDFREATLFILHAPGSARTVSAEKEKCQSPRPGSER